MTTHSRPGVPRTAALVYVRVSRLDEEERARKLSPDTQREKALALPELVGLTVEVFEDLDISGKDTANRPGYLKLMERLERGDVRYVVGYDLSRMMRNLGDQQDFFTALNRHGATFLDSSRGRVIDVTDEGQELVANIEGAVNQHARKQTGRRVRDTLATKVARGELVGPVPAGYIRRREILLSGKIARTWVEPDPERAPVIQLIFTEYATGTYSLKDLARSLNDRGVRPPRAPDFRNGRAPAQLITADTLKDILTNPRYVGRVPRRDGATFPAAYTALVDEATWTACVEVRERGKPIHRNARANASRRWTSPYLLSGVLRCAACGSTMSGQTSRADVAGTRPTSGARRGGLHTEDRHRYVCYRRRVARACDAPSLRQEVLEPEIMDILRAVALPDGIAEAVDAAVADALAQEARPSPKTTRKALDERARRLNEMYELGRLTRVAYDLRYAELEAERATLAEPLPVLAKQAETLHTLADEWETTTPRDRRRMLELIFAEIRADRDGVSELIPREDWKRYVRNVVPAGPGLIVRASAVRTSPVFRSEVVTVAGVSCPCFCRARTAST